ncbi:NADH dehydrogenase subunit L [Desulfacinum hydrothermale DSM 13146]|uniref:NADH dehydrogenase subunit L n=1 Tax=Desulfacinum hydrothermale DSM 13146 TaxID=1121390 RepID=A0A1W1XN04_9BACT|nr:NADH-quinone oxidoreductase subunit L [Desulfacinum hydrothermale]SMC25244.1 NADH dehydrogenase subunit L [Desulfacinum hydrothermale DSM 13146]
MMWLAKDPVLLAASACATLPFVSMVVILIFTRRYRSMSAAISISAIAACLLSALYLLWTLRHAPEPVQYQWAWIVSNDMIIPFGFLLDRLSLLMLTIVAVIAFLVQVYSLGYMAGDPGFSRYYAFQSLFAWAMMTMVIAPGMLQLYIFWELVGLASYLLIGFYYEKWSASQAGKKAFVMTRLGDIGFFLGIIAVLLGFGDLGILSMNEAAQAHRIAPSVVTLSALLIFCGVVGKSAQFPLLTWLPDAMEGPTPVSALLHSATMVAAGVYMMSRIFPFFAASPDAMAVTLFIGTVTMLLASTMAMVAYDIKQVWAYSTISQLGFMVMALGAGGYFAGVFHLTTHAGFKALLFLCSGIFIHEYHTNDMREIGRGGGRKLIIPMVCMTVGALALSGIFPLSGFFSKEAIMGVLAAKPNKVWLVAGLLGALMTAYYSFRLIFMILFPRQPAHHDAAHQGTGHDDHGHEAGHHGATFWAMAWPVMILAGITLVLGFFHKDLEHFLLGAGPAVHEAEFHGEGAGHGLGHYVLLFSAVSLALGGIVWAWLEFGRKGAAQEGFLRRYPKVEALFANRWYIDHAYRWLLDHLVYGGFTNLFTRNDRRVIDGAIDGICRFTVGGGRVVSFLQSGMVQYNLVLMVAGVGAVILFFVL